MYEVALAFLLTLGVLNKACRPFAAVMVANMALNYYLVLQHGLFIWVPAVDAAAFIAIAALMLLRPSWWSIMVFELAFAAVLTHVAFLLLDRFGFFFGGEYQTILGGAFLLSALLLVYGGYDGNRLVGAFVRRCFGSADQHRGSGYRGSETLKDHREDVR